MAEIPLVYPNHVDKPRRYLVDGITKRLVREEVPRGHLADAKNGPAPIFEESLSGSASVSELELFGKSLLLTTSAKMESPEILCVALSTGTTSESADLQSPILLELNLSQLELRPLVAVRAFAKDGTWIRLVLVDCQGTFVSIPLTPQLFPASDKPSSVQISAVTNYISEITVLQEVTGSELQSTMVAFLSPTRVIIALSPLVITVDLDKVSSYIWSETQCLEDMRARASSFGGLLTNMSDLFLGRLESGVMDMSPTAALCLTTSANPLLDDTYCITLHSDASVRKWKLTPSGSPLPLEVSVLNATGLPMPSLWSDRRNSVALCSRIYDGTYAVCVHIKTQGLLNELPENDGDMGPQANRTDCHLWVLHGNAQETEGSQGSSISLTVPDEAVALIGMAFSPTASRCTLSVLFESMDTQHERSATIHLTYPPSIMSIVSPEAAVVGHGSLDIVASKERSRIRALLMGPSILQSMEGSTLEQILHQLDSMYLKYMFRPMFPRGTGTVLPPSEECIRRALAKLVRGYAKSSEGGRSIELETIRTIYEWRRRESRRVGIMTPARSTRRNSSTEDLTTGFSQLEPKSPFEIYESLVQGDENYDDDDMSTDAQDTNWEKAEQELSAAVEAHERRWRRLLLQVWEEEQWNRLPLCVAWLASQPVQVMVRSGVTTSMTDRPSIHEEVTQGPWGTAFDGIALKLLSRIEQDNERSARLFAVEQQVTSIVAKAQLAVEPFNQGLIHELTALARWAWADVDGDDDTDAEYDHVEKTIRDLSPSELIGWIQATPKNSSGGLPGLEIIDSNEGLSSADEVTWSQNEVANYQLRHAACALSLRCVDSVRRLQLGRCLLLLDIVEGSHARDAALRAYLHGLTILWTSSQFVSMPLTVFQSKKNRQREAGSPSIASPPNKRPSFGDDAKSVLSPMTSSMTTAMDVSIIEVSQTMEISASSLPISPVGVSIILTRLYFRKAFSSRENVTIGNPSLLPELGALPRPKNDVQASDYPRLALRLLAPYVAFPLEEDSPDIVLARKESLARCLLVEAHKKANGHDKSQMRQNACKLLVPKTPRQNEGVQHQMILTAVDALESKQQSNISSDEGLVETLQKLVPKATAIEVQRLCKLETLKRFFSPVGSGIFAINDRLEYASIKFFAETMLHLSRVRHRLEILEYHLNVRGGEDDDEDPSDLLRSISDAIEEMKKTFPERLCQTMPEHENMWAQLFNHAVLAGNWTTAYQACVRNPVSDRRETNFRRMIRSMVDQGALNDLSVLCTELIKVSEGSESSTIDDSETVDLYEIATETLADAVSHDTYSVRASSTDPAGLSDYQGALYALHASQKHWRRAAQALDLRFLNAQKAFGSSSRRSRLNPQAMELRDGLIVEDMVLASVGAFNAIELTKEAAHKFIVSGEYGPYNKIALEIDDEFPDASLQSSTKRSYGRGDVYRSEKKAEGSDRLSNFMTSVELQGRAIRNMALRLLFLDRSSTPRFAKSAFLRRIDSSKDDIDELFNTGYYHQGLLLAKAFANNRKAETGSSSPEGTDLFHDCLSHLLGSYLIPAVLTSAEGVTRPSLHQVEVTLSSSCSSDYPPCTIADRSHRVTAIKDVALDKAIMSLIRKLVLDHSTPKTPIAVDAASFFLEYDNSTLPAWLERLLLGANTRASAGMFAPRSNSGELRYGGDPSALLSLYTKSGLLAEACDIVTFTLSAVDSEGRSPESKAASRLPEKGDIDFVPYNSIDLLWNLIEVTLSKGVLGQSETERVSSARATMKKSLEKHFALLQISEAGMRSARALVSR